MAAYPLKSRQPRRAATPAELGGIVRAVRKDTGIDQKTAADLAGVGPRFLGELENGKPTVRLSLVLQTLQRLGLEVWIAPRGWTPPGSNDDRR